MLSLGDRLVFVGERSYSLYLVQYLAMTTVIALVPSYAGHSTRLFVATTVLGLLAADLLYRWVEQPMIGVGRLFSGQRKGNPHHHTGRHVDRHVHRHSDRRADAALRARRAFSERTVPATPVLIPGDRR